ncbi:hypothetical protein [Planctomyces sp. SH-PL62]|uniref:hypothetical protein n=1 Tax=Planctomyces sp. SH-PL62 TaxID=1636152 RepID=UPI00078D34F1|nr:hypothetical protein [Planctomyces sp. SH-PL62]AMV39253.1 hypothetical protein VT85_17580 [Planctomyces sp. SH-PL62]
MPTERWMTAAGMGLVAFALMLSGCSPRTAASLELVGRDVRSRVPEQLAALLPDDVVLCLDEERQDGEYRLWILRGPGRERLRFPASLRGLESHRRPTSALTNLLAARLPSLTARSPSESHCRFTHWRLPDGAEIQIREVVLEAEWFASVERVAM